jgi:hypothetical protein
VGERWSACVLLSLLALTTLATAANAEPKEHTEPTVDELKAKISAASVGDKPRLCIEVAELQLKEADKLYATGEIDKAQTSLTDVVAFSELARDYSIQSHKHQKQSEIAVRAMTRKLNDILHTLGHEDQAAVKDALTRLERVRDDLLASMFKRGSS